MTPAQTAPDLTLAVARAIAEDPHLDTWCREQFGRGPTVWIDVNDEDPPELDDYPVIAVLGITGDDRGGAKAEARRELHLGFAVENPAVESDGALRIHTGFIQAETLRELAEAAIYRAGLGGTGTEGASASESRPPVFTSFSVITITHLRSTRRSMPGK